jgi:hypothetical protein
MPSFKYDTSTPEYHFTPNMIEEVMCQQRYIKCHAI